MTRQPPSSQASPTLDDSGAGLAMFVIFTAAVLIVTGTVAIVALVNTWWILGVAFAVHLVMTGTVLITIVSVMDGRASASAHRPPAQSRPGETRRPAPTKVATAL